MKLSWLKCVGDVWCKLSTVNLSHQHFDSMNGVYIIWHGGSNPQTVYVGSGNIRERLKAHKNAQDILRYEDSGLFVTWARVAGNEQLGVEAYLADSLHPLVGDRHPGVDSIRVNLPWES